MAEKTVVLPVRMTEADFKRLQSQTPDGKAPSEFAREVLANNIRGFSGKVNPRGGARNGAGRPAKPPRQPQAS